MIKRFQALPVMSSSSLPQGDDIPVIRGSALAALKAGAYTHPLFGST
jgi:hypothetical protein